MATAKTDQVPSREELNSLVDTKKALFWQVHKLGRHYDVWTHRPLAGTFRLFEWDFMEVLSKTHWWVIPLYWTPVILSLILSGSYCTNTPAAATAHLLPSINGTIQSETLAARSLPSRGPFGLGTDLLCSIYPPTEQANTPESLLYILPLGMLIWTLVEYTLHRFVFHMAISGESAVLTTFHFMIHGLHHKFPMDPMRLVFPPVPGSAIAYLLHSLMCLLPVARNVARGLTGGMMIGYVVYDLMHYYLHHGKVVTTYLADLKDAHVAHHYRDHSKGFGISSKLWDVPFNTLDTSDFKRKST